MKRFSTREVELSIGNGYYFQLKKRFFYTTDVRIQQMILNPQIEIKPFKTDLSSHPWWTNWMIPARGKFNLPSIVHDYLLQHPEKFPTMTREQKDLVFVEALEDVGVKRWRCRLMYAGVRVNSFYRELFR